MKEMNRREFVKAVTIGGTVLGLGGIMFHKPLEAIASGKYDIGQCKNVRIKCVSEVGWFDTKVLIGQRRINVNKWLENRHIRLNKFFLFVPYVKVVVSTTRDALYRFAGAGNQWFEWLV